MTVKSQTARDKEIETPVACVEFPQNHNQPETETWMPLSKLVYAPEDPRRYSKRDIKKAEGIIRKFGVIVPLIVGSDCRILAGALIFLAAQNLGLEELPIILADDLSSAEQKALSLALNRLYELGEFDQQLLGTLAQDLEIDIPGFDRDWIGFDQGEIDLAISSLETGEEVEVELAPSHHSSVTNPGDVWILGDHHIGCGDAADIGFYEKLLCCEEAAMVFTDPPYGCKVAGFVTTRNHREFAQASGEQSDDELARYFTSWFASYLTCTKPGALIYICIDWRSLDRLLQASKPLFGKLVNLLVWTKDRAGMGSLYRSQHELIALFKNPGGDHQNNIELGRHGRNRSNVWSYPSAMSFGQSGAEGDLLDDHPTPKPQMMIADAIQDCTKRGDIVLDPFLGSGSTVIAAEKTGRRCKGMDLDPAYVDLVIQRWQRWSGKYAVLKATGEKFDEIAARRLHSSPAEEGSND